MTVSAHWYTKGLVAFLNKETDWNSDSIYCALLDNTYTPAQDTDAYWADVKAHEVTGTGYTANGAALTSLVLTTGGTHEAQMKAADTSWASSTITARYAVVYDRTPSTDATRDRKSTRLN